MAPKMLVESERSLWVRVAVAARSVAFEVLFTLPSPTSDATIPVGVLITGEVRVLLVRVSVVALPMRVSVALGRVRVLAVVKVVANMPVIPVVLPEVLNPSFFVASVVSIIFGRNISG